MGLQAEMLKLRQAWHNKDVVYMPIDLHGVNLTQYNEESENETKFSEIKLSACARANEVGLFLRSKNIPICWIAFSDRFYITNVAEYHKSLPMEENEYQSNKLHPLISYQDTDMLIEKNDVGLFHDKFWNTPHINRTSEINAALQGQKSIILGGLDYLECAFLTAVQALEENYNVYMCTDATNCPSGEEEDYKKKILSKLEKTIFSKATEHRRKFYEEDALTMANRVRKNLHMTNYAELQQILK